MTPIEDDNFGNLVLKGFQEITEPTLIHWLPVTPAIYGLIFIIGVYGCRCAYLKFKHFQANAYRREALAELKSISQAYGRGYIDDKAYLKRLRLLLKATALRVYPRGQLAALTGVEWADFLNKKTEQAYFTHQTDSLMEFSLYQRQFSASKQVLSEFSSSISLWLEHHTVLSLSEESAV